MADAEQNSPEMIIEVARAERDRIETELSNIDTKLEQSQGELGRLQGQNSKVTVEMKNLERDLESTPRSRIVEIYGAAQEIQQRLFVMRGQVERFQAERGNLSRYSETLDQLLGVVVSKGSTTDDSLASEEAAPKSNAIRIVEAQEAERKRLANQMHDGPAQSLTNFILQAEICQRLFDRDVERAREELLNLKSSASTTFQRVREFIFDLRPMMLDDLGLGPTVRRFVDTFSERTGIPTQANVIGERDLEAYQQVIIFRAIQELLANVREHANASEVTVVMDTSGDLVKVSVDDNGQGLSEEQIETVFNNGNSVGLPVMQERIELIGGEMQIDSVVGRGTKVTLTLPAA